MLGLAVRPSAITTLLWSDFAASESGRSKKSAKSFVILSRPKGRPEGRLINLRAHHGEVGIIVRVRFQCVPEWLHFEAR